jgi:acyl-CoA synthetase (AMP-forming)/AMP-acid ligase II
MSTLTTATTAADECGIPRSNIFVFNMRGENALDGHQSWTQLLQNGEADWTSVPDPDTTAAAYVSTSGTSGLPKAAILSHTYMVSQAEILSRTLSVSPKVSFISNTRSSLKIAPNCSGLTPRGPATFPRLPHSNPTCNSTSYRIYIIYHATI